MPEGAIHQGAERLGRAWVRPATWLAWLVWTAIVVSGATLLDLSDVLYFWFVLTNYFWRYPDLYGEVLVSGMMVFTVPAYATVGAVVASLRPKNGIGWLCLFFSLLLLGASWQPGDVSLIDRMEVLQNLAWLLLCPPLPLTLMLLIFPEGRPPSRRWWAAAAAAVAGTILVAITGLFPAHPAAGLAVTVGFSVSLVALLASVVAVVLRWRSSKDRERQQIKLLVYAVAVTVAAVITAVASWYVSGDIPGAVSYVTVLAGVVGFASIALGIPIAIGIAILRHRLYDVDFLINRTLVYGSLTATLTMVYVGAVVSLQQVLGPLVAGGSQLAVVASTLAIAALFMPLRHRIQGFIDRRFYRKRYDARKTLDAFSAALRDETDLAALNDDLVGVVRETMQPTHVSMWLRPDTVSKKRIQAD